MKPTHFNPNKDPFYVKPSPGWIGDPDEQYKKDSNISFLQLQKNQHGHIKLTKFHFKFLTDEAMEIDKTNYLLALKLEEDYFKEYSAIGLIPGYYLIDANKNIIAFGEVYQHYDCTSFINSCINNMRFV